MPDTVDDLPRRHARSQRFTLGRPRTFRVAADGSRVSFLRSSAGDDPVNRLWVLDVDSATEREVVDPAGLGTGDREIAEAELARRERARESAGGIVGYDTDRDLSIAVFVADGAIHLADLTDQGRPTRRLDTIGAPFDPRLSPDGSRVAYATGSDLGVTTTAGNSASTVVARAEDPDVTWGRAEFIAAEEMRRFRGFWWAPDGSSLLATRVDTTDVARWWISSPVEPWSEPRPVAYPAAGTANARVELVVLPVRRGGSPVTVDWSAGGTWEYLADVSWTAGSLPFVVVQSRDQRTLAVLEFDAETGATHEIHRQHDEHWVEIVPGAPCRVGDRLVTVADRDGARRILIDGVPATPPDLQVSGIVDVDTDRILLTATTDATESQLWRLDADGSLRELTQEPGIHTAVARSTISVVSAASLDHDGAVTTVFRGEDAVATLHDHSWSPGEPPSVTLLRVGERAVNTALVLPRGHDGTTRLPVLLDPYGGPHALRVQKARGAYTVPQWFADQGFAVVIADGRGTPGRGPEFERAVRGDLAGPVLEDQVTALHGVAEEHPFLDLTRVAIRGWSFGGYLAALAVIRRPDVFRAAIAGAPVTDWRLYDTHYTERYLGHPGTEPQNYARTDLCAEAAGLTRPLMLVHGLADDNVVAAHTLALSRALLEAGRPHEVLPLSGVTHMTPQETVAENLLRLQVDFLRRHLGG
ncbi:MAG: prolyl oligopeptidase family serine peptidase [Acidimicrobiales bacterium]